MSGIKRIIGGKNPYDTAAVALSKCRIAQNFSGRKLWQIVANKHFGNKTLADWPHVLHSKIARIKIVDG